PARLGHTRRTPRVLDRRVSLPGYDGPVRQPVIEGLGHEEPTLPPPLPLPLPPLTNQMRHPPARLTGRYPPRAAIENDTDDGFDRTDLPVPWLGRKRLRLAFG